LLTCKANTNIHLVLHSLVGIYLAYSKLVIMAGCIDCTEVVYC